MQNLWEYTSMRKTLLSRRIYLLVSACEENCAQTNAKEASGARGNLNCIFTTGLQNSQVKSVWKPMSAKNKHKKKG